MQIPTTRLDLECGDLASSGDEKERSSGQPNRSELVQARSVVRVGRVVMPPELIVTSTQNNDLSVFERLYKSVQQPKGLEVSQSLPKGICPRCSPRKILKDLSPMSDPELKSKGEDEFPFKQPFWRIFPNGHLSLESPNSIPEQLKACSEKLIELKRRHKLKKIKHAANYNPPKILLVNMRVKRRSKSLRIESSSQISENTEERLKTKSMITIQKIEDNLIRKPTGKTKKFRKGGFVSLATVNTNLQENVSVDETTDGTSKKKKKKKKLNQLQKRVKNAVNAVSAVTVTAKVKREAFKKKSYDS